ncbi:MAG: carboxylesterase family protein [Gammaproteobacteria bacterium]|nr:carboxylesterase family protein [Gammaproteobacteria bacterium]
MERRRGKVPGAGHGSEIPFVFATLSELPMSRLLVADADVATSDLLHRYWVNFATRGDPNGDRLQVWPRYERDGDVTLVIGSSVSATPQFRRPQLDLHQARWEASRPR